MKGPKFLCQDESHWSGTTEIPALTDDDPEVSKLFKAALKRVQQVFFPNFLEIVSSTENHKGGNCVKTVLQKAGAPLYQLNPQPMEGLPMVGGRLVNAPLTYGRKHPVALPYKH